MIEKISVLIIFFLCYAVALSRKVKLAYVSLISALALILLGLVSFSEAGSFVNLDVLGIYWGYMMVSIAFSYSKMPEFIANRILDKIHKEKYILLALCSLTALLSAVMENVGVVLMMAPVAISISKKLNSNLFYYLIPVAISANIVTTLTMVADPPSIILAMKTGLNFFTFYWFQNKPSIGIISFFGILASMLTLLFIFRHKNKLTEIKKEYIKVDIFPSILFIVSVLCLAFLPEYGVSQGIIGVSVGMISLLFYFKRSREMFDEFDWNSFFFIIGIFIVVGALESTGILVDFANFVGTLGISSPLFILIFISLISLIASSFVDNVPWTILMIPVCQNIASILNMNPFPLLFGMLIGTGMGGNITPVGATANVFACGILEKRGYKINLKEYLKISIPFTLSAVFVSIIFLILFWLI